MTEQMLSPEDQIMQWITSKWITKPLYVAAELGIADLLRDGPLSIDTLAAKTGTHAQALYRLLRALAAVGIFAEEKDDTFKLTPLSQCLLSDAMRPLALMFLSNWHDKVWDKLLYTIRTGKPGFDKAFGKPAFEWMEENPEERAILDQGQGLKGRRFADVVDECYDFSKYKLICDIGGGNGSFLTRLLANYPQTSGVVADLPGVADSAEKEISRLNLNDRCKVVPYDFFKGAPPVCDGYFLVNVLHDWDDKTCSLILKNITQSMDAHSKLWIVEYALEPESHFSVAKLLDIEVLVMGGGRERSLKEYTALFNSVGLRLSEAIPTKQGPYLMECTVG